MTTLMVTERTFNTIQQSIAWLETFLNDVESAIAIIADGKLPSHLWPTEAMTKILTEVTQQLPNGWELMSTTEKIWSIYKSAKVHLAANENRLKLFITTPVYDRKHAFQLYKIHHLPTPIHSTHAIMYENLPSGLAVANDMQTVVELQEEEMRKCSEKDPACLLQRAMNGL